MTTVDVGDAFELTFTTAPGATVTSSWYDNYRRPRFEDQAVAESPAASGKFPQTFLPDAAGMWQVLFHASGAATQVEEHWVRVSRVSGPPPLASVGDVQTLRGSMTAAQQGLARYLLRAASKMVRSRFPLVDEHIADELLDADVVAHTVAQMVNRVLRNPDGLRSQSIGPFSYAYDTTLAAGELVLSDDDAAAFTPDLSGDDASAHVGTIRIAVGMAPPKRGCRIRGW